MSKKFLVATPVALMVSASFAFADVGHGNDIGKAGSEAEVDRVIEITMDEMKFEPERIEVQKGETIKFVVINVGRAVHELNFGTEQMWAGHGKEMRVMFKEGMMTNRTLNHDKMMAAGMMHNDPNSILLEPDESGELIWTFSKAAEMGFACNVPGHREAGMVGEVVFK